MDDELTAEQSFWLERLMTLHSGESIGEMPGEVRGILIQRGFAHLRRGEIEITFDGIRFLMARR
jgi:hypothetical protein